VILTITNLAVLDMQTYSRSLSISFGDDNIATDGLFVNGNSQDSNNSSTMQSFPPNRSIYKDNEDVFIEDLLVGRESKCNSQSSQVSSHILNYDSSNCSIEKNYKEEDNIFESIDSSASLNLLDIFRENENTLESYSSASSTCPSPDICRVNSNISESRFSVAPVNSISLRLEKVNSILKERPATAIIPSSPLVQSNLSPVELSLSPGGKRQSAISFANQCLVRSYERRFRSTGSTIPLPPNVLRRPCTAPQSTGSSMESSVEKFLNDVTPSSSDYQLYTPFTAPNYSAAISPESPTQELPDAVSMPFFDYKEIRRKLKVIKTKCYFQKCAQILNKSMMHYNKLNAMNASKTMESKENDGITYGCEFCNVTYTVQSQDLSLRCNM